MGCCVVQRTRGAGSQYRRGVGSTGRRKIAAEADGDIGQVDGDGNRVIRIDEQPPRAPSEAAVTARNARTRWERKAATRADDPSGHTPVALVDAGGDERVRRVYEETYRLECVLYAVAGHGVRLVELRRCAPQLGQACGASG